MTEIHVMALLGAGPIMWMLGGYKWKWIRRFVWPIIVGCILAYTGLYVWRAIVVAGAMMLVNSMPYGDRTPWVIRATVFTFYGAPACIINAHAAWFVLILSPIMLVLWMFLSRKYNYITWKTWEATAGLLQASSVIFSSLRG